MKSIKLEIIIGFKTIYIDQILYFDEILNIKMYHFKCIFLTICAILKKKIRY